MNQPKPQTESSKPKLNEKDLVPFGSEAVEIQHQKDELALKIRQIEQRLMSGYSKPLDDYLCDLMREDTKLSCQLTDILTK